MTLPLTEAQTTEQCIGFLEAERWECIRLQSGLFQRPGGKARIRIGEAGMPDWVCVRGASDRLPAKYFFLEMKSSKGRLSKAQRDWLAMAADKGIPACVADGLDSLKAWMMRRGFYAGDHLRFEYVEDQLP